MSLILYDVQERVAIVTLNRPEARNAQNTELLVALDEAFDRGVQDPQVRVIVLKANGPHFSAGHDLSPATREREPVKSLFADMKNTGMQRMYNWESKHFLGLSRKWRDLPKPTIAAVQGACIAAGLMLAWPCDLIIAADNARFGDPVVRMGIGGVEYHGHTWEWGPRKAKELLFTGGFIDAAEAHRLGMVNRVVPLAELESHTLALAHEIAQMPPFALQMAKRAVNQTMDIMGQYAAIQTVFDIHSMGHGNAMAQCGNAVMAGLEEMTAAIKKKS